MPVLRLRLPLPVLRLRPRPIIKLDEPVLLLPITLLVDIVGCCCWNIVTNIV
jgi:hypothetical protein